MNTSTRTSLHFARLALALALACGLGTWTACEQIIGLEERRRAEDGGGSGGGGPDSDACKTYCDEVSETCGRESLQAYRNEEECLAVCAFLPVGRAGMKNDANNTLMCRARAASAAEDASAAFCPAAAPGGGSPTAEVRCGSNCEAYCALYENICGEDQPNCREICEALRDRGAFSAAQDFAGGDTIQCRLSHLAAAAVHRRKNDNDNRRTECNNAQLSAALDRRDHCDLPNNTVPSCEDYCRLVQAACVKYPVYDTQDQCELVCERELLFPKGTNTVMENGQEQQDSTGDTMSCRRWHVYFAIASDSEAKRHCAHAGPTGDGHCGARVCDTYCSMLQRACKNQFDREFPGAGGMAACATACRGLRGALNEDGIDYEVGYDLMSEDLGTNTLQCRVAHLARTMSGMNSCERALPRGTCSR